MILPPVHQLVYSVQQDNVNGSELMQLLQTKASVTRLFQYFCNILLNLLRIHFALHINHVCHQTHVGPPTGSVWHSRASFVPHAAAVALQPGPLPAAISLVSLHCSI